MNAGGNSLLRSTDMDKSQMAAAVFNRRAGEYQEKFMDLDIYNSTYQHFCDSIVSTGASVLEIGCGPGNITRYLLQQRPDLQITGIDLAPRMLELARENNPAATFLLMDARNIGHITQRFDAIMCGFCLPYLSPEESAQLIRDAAGLLLPGGIIYLSTMEEDERNHSGIRTNSAGDELFIYYHQAAGLETALSDAGFSGISLQRIAFPLAGDTPVTDLVMTAAWNR
ncbi:class I SAM-dependent methyltransferase [Chitinophaga sp. 212800010-3]|uniref:class I SAM-dependent methyltransferase n=1 Tax=unclassified Chitinophaga TaxID=2619133 RepID=UPI002DF6F5F7|nr:Methyltransf-25 domain-containing protein [Chitinophaga sp. 212800010-3]